MGFDVLNPWMLAGLAGVALPILAHLLSRKRYDVVEWGAMQFLELDPNARRRLRLEDLLLLLLRIALIVLVALALARPWVSGAWLGRFGSHQSRDVAVVLDGSDSMSWRGPLGSPEQSARQFVQSLVDSLYPGDTISIFDARGQTTLLIGPTRDFRKALQLVEQLPPPSGTAQLAAAVLQATQLLTRTSHLQRDVVVLSDRQAKSWQADDDALWRRLDELRSLSAVPIRLWACDVSPADFGQTANLTVDRLTLSRELTVPDVPVRLKTKVRQSGGQEARLCKVYLSIDGERLNDETLQVRLPEQGEANVDFELRLTSVGSHVLTVSVDDDPLPADNRSDAVAIVRDGLPVLFLEGTPSNDPVRTETFFAQAALAGPDDGTPWIRATVATAAETDFERLSQYAVIVLANVASLEETQAEWLDKLVRSAGRSVLIACGDQLQRDVYDKWYADGQGWLPCRLDAIVEDTAVELRGVRVQDESLALPWLVPFRADRGGTLADARFARWWKLGGTASLPGEAHEKPISPLVAARLNTGDPWLLYRRIGRGTVAVLTSTLDADWNTLPAKSDYVPWLHELLFFLANADAARNVEPGQPLVLPLGDDVVAKDFVVRDPRGKLSPAERGGDAVQRLARFDNPQVAGVYQFERQNQAPGRRQRPEYFAVQTDRAESDLTPLTDAQRAQLTAGDRLRFVTDLSELNSRMATDTSRSEIWQLLLYAFLLLLLLETWLTRRYVRGAQSVSESQDAHAPSTNHLP